MPLGLAQMIPPPDPYVAYLVELEPRSCPRVEDVILWKGQTYPVCFWRTTEDPAGWKWLWEMRFETVGIYDTYDFLLLRSPWQRGQYNDFTFSEFLRRVTSRGEPGP